MKEQFNADEKILTEELNSDTVEYKTEAEEASKTPNDKDVSVIRQKKGEKLKKKIKNFFTYNVAGQRPRIWELDLVRGIIMVGVIFDHICRFSYSWGIIQYQTAFGKALESVAAWYLGTYFCKHAYPYALWLLCFLSGISCQFSHSSARRLIKFWVLTVIIMGGYLALHFIIPNLVKGYVLFNIVAVLTLSVTFWYALDKLKIPDLYRIFLGALIVAAGITLFYYNRFHEGGVFVENKFFALFIYNKNGYKVSPGNFEPLIPHIGFFILGGVFGRHFYRDKTTKFKRQTPPKWLSPIMILSKHSLEAYLLLPYLFLAVLWLIVKFVGLFL